MKINLFSPLPPVRSEIARQTATLLPLLARRAEVIVWTSELEWEPWIEEHATVRHYDPERAPWRQISEGDVTFYQMGNDPRYHHAIWRVSQQHPGIVILHDLKLQHFFAGMVFERRELLPEGYLELGERHHSLGGRRRMEDFLEGKISVEQLAEECPLTGAGIDRALAVIVHSETACDAVADLCLAPVACLPLCSSGVSKAGRRTAKERPPNEPYRLLVFGYLGSNRRLPTLLRALALFPERHRFHLDVYGTIRSAEKFAQLICNLGLSELVTMHGFVSDEELDVAMQRADLAINLRFPSLGEASASQLHLWQYALPSLITETGWYATLPANTVGFVRPEHELADIHAHLAAFLADPAQYREIGRNGLDYVRAHCSPERYADGLIELATRVPEFQSTWIARDLAERAGAAMTQWNGSLDDELLNSVKLLNSVIQKIQLLAAAVPPPFSSAATS